MSKTETINIAIISNINVEPYFSRYLINSFSECIKANTSLILFEDFLSVENIKKIVSANFIVVLLNFDYFYPNYINDLINPQNCEETIIQDYKLKCEKLYSFLRGKSHAHILWMGAEDYCYYHYTHSLGYSLINKGLIDVVNSQIYNMLELQDSYIDLKRLIAKIGIDNAYDNKGKYRWNSPYSTDLLFKISREIYRQYLVDLGRTPKCLVLDCDNVLWGGILSEDGIENIKLDGSGLGRSFQDFQRFLLMLYYHGVILAICSKNDEEDVLRVIREHSGMLLKEEHIACIKANWNNKPDNILLISKELNIGLDSIVFVDDMQFEVDFVKSALPEVTAIQYHRDTIYEKLSCFKFKFKVDFENINYRTHTYKTNIQREQLKSMCSSYDEYLNALELKVDIHMTNQSELGRISELSQRTNKCTNGIRYTVEELKEKINTEEYTLYSVYLSDKFSDLGLVGTIGIIDFTLDLFSLSCRAFGRGVERIMVDIVKENNVKKYIFCDTGKNGSLKDELKSFLLRLS